MNQRDLQTIHEQEERRVSDSSVALKLRCIKISIGFLWTDSPNY